MECVMGHHTGKFSRCSFFFHKLKDDYTQKKFRVGVGDPAICTLMVWTKLKIMQLDPIVSSTEKIGSTNMRGLRSKSKKQIPISVS
jgi:hypothetical protein